MKKIDTTFKQREKKKYIGSYSPKMDAKDKALGKVKESGKNRYCIYSPDNDK